MVATAIMLLAALSGGDASVKHWQFLEKSSAYTVVKVNPAAYTTTVFVGKKTPGAQIVFNTNYFWKRVPIGVLQDPGAKFVTIYAYNDVRPVMVRAFGGQWTVGYPSEPMSPESLAVQAGPLLVKDSSMAYVESFKLGKYQGDVARSAQRMAVGVTAYNKIVIVYSPYASLKQMAQKLLRHGVVEGMNMDGGNSAYLSAYGAVDGYSPFIGMAFIERQ